MIGTRLPLVVSDVHDDAPATRGLRLRHRDGVRLPAFPPGSHLGVFWDEGRANFYSLTRADLEPSEYRISVKLDPDGHGGSRWIHGLRVGDVVEALPPRSAFAPVARGRHHVLVAGGIGITPLLTHAAWHRRWGTSFEAWFVGDIRGNALVDRLRDLAGDRLRTCPDRRDFWARFAPRPGAAPFASEVYICGPDAMIRDVRAAALAAAWPEQRIHSESFGPKEAGGRPFDAVLARSGRAIRVPADRSFLEALEAEGVRVPNLCRNGVCGECVTAVLRGGVEHRDDYLSDEERASGTLLMPCVSRASGERVEVEL
jgi:ferredoxin-NADP reductase